MPDEHRRRPLQLQPAGLLRDEDAAREAPAGSSRPERGSDIVVALRRGARSCRLPRASPSRTRFRPRTSPSRSSRTDRSAFRSRSRSTSPAPFSGAYRDIPLRTASRSTRSPSARGSTKYRPGANTELGGFGLPDTLRRRPASRRRCGSSGTTARATSARTFTISYRFRGLAVAYDDVVDVNLRVWGDHWPAALGNLTVGMKLPRPTPLGPSYRVWGSPAWVRGSRQAHPRPRRSCEAVRNPGAPVRRVPRGLPAEPAHVDRGRTGSAGQRAPEDRRRGGRLAARVRARPRANRRRASATSAGRCSTCCSLGFGPAAALLALVWLVYGRERKTGLRPRVRAGAAVRPRAGARAAAAAPGEDAGLERVHGDALRPDPPRPLQGDPRDDRDARSGAGSATRTSPTSR